MNIKVTYSELFRQGKKYDHFEKIWAGSLLGNLLDIQDVKKHGIFRVGKNRPHQGGLGFDVKELADYPNVPSEAKTIIRVFEALGFVWEGPSDPVHFTARLEMTRFSSIKEANVYNERVFELNFMQKYGDYECPYGYDKY